MDPRKSSTIQIPYDILISIVDELALRKQSKELSACSQTCRMLLHRCRVHLFSSVTVDTNAPRFAALLNQNPKIQAYIRELSYHPAILSEEIANAFLLLRSLKSLVLLGSTCYTYATPCPWGSLTPHIQHALIHLFNSPSVTRIQIYGVSDVPAILLSSCSNLEYLDIDRHASFTSEFCNIGTVLAPPKLVSLDVAKALRPTVESLLNERRADGLPLLDISGLRSLNISMMHGPEEERHLAQILRSTPELEHLCFSVSWEALIPDSLVPALTFSLPTLRSLKMEWNIDSNGVSEKFPGLIRAIQALAHHPNNINEFNLILWSSWSHNFADQDWERIDQVLADRSAFRRLEKLSIKFWTELDVSKKAEEKRIQDQLTKFKITRLPRLSLAGRDYLDFQVTLDEEEPRWIFEL